MLVGMKKSPKAPKLNPSRAIALVRVSTEDQNLGVEAQRNQLRAYAVAQCLELVEIIEERVSGAADLDDRQGFVQALVAMKAHSAGVLLLTARDRLARDIGQACAIERAVEAIGGLLRTCDSDPGDDPTSRFMRAVLDAVAQLERDLIRARTKAALQAKKARGELIGGVPFGQRLSPDGRTLEPNPKEQEVIQAARDLRTRGKSLQDIIDALFHLGHRPRRGEVFHKMQVSRMLQ